MGLRLLQRVGPQARALALNPLHVGLQAYYKLDEASGTAQDAHSTNHLSDVNTVTSNPGKVGTSRQFTYANSEYLTVPSNSMLQTGDIDFTIAGWVYLDGKSANQAVVGKWTGAPAGEYLLFYNPGTDRFRFIVCDTTQTNYGLVDASALGSPATGTWYFIVAWHDSVANTVNIQVNNGTVNSASHPYDVQVAATAFRMGATGAAGQEWNGRIDELGLWKRVLTPAERTQLYASGSGVTYPTFTPPAPSEPLLVDLISYWKLDEASGNAVDAHSTNHLTDTNTVTSDTGRQGTARRFAAANTEYFTTPNNASLQSGNIDFTIAAWVYMDSGSTARTVVAKWGGGQGEYWLGAYDAPPSKVLFQVSPDGTANPSVVGDALPAGGWHFLVAWHDSVANTLNAQVDNGSVLFSSHTTGVFSGTAAFRMGYDGSWPWEGRIDEVGFWKRVLTADERTRLYAGGSGTTYPDFAAPTIDYPTRWGLVSYWKLDEASGTRADSHGTNPLLVGVEGGNQPGKLGNAAAFAAAGGQYYSAADTAILALGDVDFWVAGWFKLTTLGIYIMLDQATITPLDSSVHALQFGMITDRFRFLVGDNATHVTNVLSNSFGAISTEVWYFVMGWHDAVNNTVNIRVNHGAIDSVSHTFGSHNADGPFFLGANGPSITNYMDGIMDAVAFGKSPPGGIAALADEISSRLYNAGAGREYPWS